MLTLFTGYSPVFTSLCIFIHLHFHRCISLSIYKSDCLYLTYVSGSLCLSMYLLCCLPNHSTVCLLVSVCLLLSLTSRVSLAPSPSSRSPSSIHTGIAFLLSSSASLPLSFYSLYFSFPSSFPPPPTSFSPSSSTLFPFLPSCPPSRPSSHTKHFPSPPQQGGGGPFLSSSSGPRNYFPCRRDCLPPAADMHPCQSLTSPRKDQETDIIGEALVRGKDGAGKERENKRKEQSVCRDERK